MKTVAVITSTIGRSHLERAILSVQKQTYPCKHYVFVDGEQFAKDAKQILDKYPHVIATYLPMNTGANGWTNSSINAIAPFLVKEDVICYLDDDNWYEANHVENSLKVLNETGADYVFASGINDQGGNFFAILRLDYSSKYTHFLDYEDDQVLNTVLQNHAILPNPSQKLSEAFIVDTSNGQYQLIERKYIVEGKKITIQSKGSIFDTLTEMEQDLQSSISYAGGTTLQAIKKVDYVIVKNSIFNGDR